jgi:uncharacterized protein
MTNDVIGRGVPYPVRLENGRLSLIGGPLKIRQSIEIILGTAPGERQMLPKFGCGIHDLVFQANTSALRGIVQTKVRDALTRWEPRIDVMDVRVETAPDARNMLLIYVDYRIRADNSFFNLVYPYYLVEGAR